ncbi:MAG TPA: serine O-acetyltransferase [Tenuifilaceae bacterium]|nr:serine O-acetyltransferase [Tenuifilaceae bacterium]
MDFLRFRKKYNIKVEVEEFTQLVLMHLFPKMLNRRTFNVSSSEVYRELNKLLKKQIGDSSKADLLAKEFTTELPLLQKELMADANTIAKNDPAASGIDEVIITYPGFLAICIYRLAHYLANKGVPLIPRIMTEWAHSRTGIDIHPKASIGKEFFIDHGTGIVIGETAIIGNRVKIYQGVTIGALSVSKELAQTKRHPTIEDNVVIYAGSTILGGNTTIGQNSIIGGNVWLTKSVEPNSLVYHESKVIVRERETVSRV